MSEVVSKNNSRWGTFFTTAPLCRYAEDLELLLNAVKEADGPKLSLYKEVDVYKINFHFTKDDYSELTQKVSPCIKESLLKVAKHFGAKEIDLPLLKWSLGT